MVGVRKHCLWFLGVFSYIEYFACLRFDLGILIMLLCCFDLDLALFWMTVGLAWCLGIWFMLFCVTSVAYSCYFSCYGFFKCWVF